MGSNIATEGFQNILHIVAQALLVPVMIVLLILILYALYHIGTLIAEFFTEHRHLNVEIPDLLDLIDEAPVSGLPEVVEHCGMLARQRHALLTLLAHAQLPLDDQVALANQISFSEQEVYNKVVGKTDAVARVAPIVGLMGTLIPLGPGITALSTGDTQTLSSALLIAFDTTTTGLLASILAMAVSKVRLAWYARYSSQLEAAMTAILRKVRDSQSSDNEIRSTVSISRELLIKELGTIPDPIRTKAAKRSKERKEKQGNSVFESRLGV